MRDRIVFAGCVFANPEAIHAGEKACRELAHTRCGSPAAQLSNESHFPLWT
jgi:hypothetical protein